MTTIITTAPETKPSIKRALISLALDANSFIRDQLLAWEGDEYARIGAEPVLEVPQSGHCWIVSGRHDQTMVSRTLPIWDVNAVNVVVRQRGRRGSRQRKSIDHLRGMW